MLEKIKEFLKRIYCNSACCGSTLTVELERKEDVDGRERSKKDEVDGRERSKSVQNDVEESKKDE